MFRFLSQLRSRAPEIDFDKIGLSNNIIFTEVMQDRENCRKMLEILLEKPIARIGKPRAEEHFESGYYAKGIRVDIYVEEVDTDGKTVVRAFDVEMQTQSPDWLPLRARYYHATMDTSLLKRGMRYRDLPESIVIFICLNDPFNEGLPRYTARRVLEECPNVEYDDRQVTIFFNCAAYPKAKNPALQSFLGFVSTQKSDGSDYLNKLATDIADAKKEPMMRNKIRQARAYFSDIEEMARIKGLNEGIAVDETRGREAGRAEGRAEGIAVGEARGRVAGMQAGRAEEARETAIRLLDMGLKVEQISQATGLSLEEIGALRHGEQGARL